LTIFVLIPCRKLCVAIPQRMRLSGTVVEIWRLKHNGARPWPFGVTWRHRSRDHSTPGDRLLLCGL